MSSPTIHKGHSGLTGRFKDLGNGLEFNEGLADEILKDNQAEWERL